MSADRRGVATGLPPRTARTWRQRSSSASPDRPSGKKPSPRSPARRAAASRVAADEDRDGRLHGLGVAADRAEAEVLAVEGRLVLLPDHAERVDGLVGAAAALVGIDARGPRPPRASSPTPTPRNRRPPERRSMVAQRLASWRGWCSGSTRMPVPEPDPLGASGQPGQQVERVGQLAVLGQRHAAGVAVGVAALVAHRAPRRARRRAATRSRPRRRAARTRASTPGRWPRRAGTAAAARA